MFLTYAQVLKNLLTRVSMYYLRAQATNMRAKDYATVGGTLVPPSGRKSKIAELS